MDSQNSGGRKCVERRLGLTGDIQADMSALSPEQGRTLRQNVERTRRVRLISSTLRDILLPIFNNISDVLMIIFLWRKHDKTFAYMTLALFYLPTIFLLAHFASHFRKANHFLAKLSIFSLLGPSMDWILNIFLLVRGKTPAEFDGKTKNFLDIIKVVNGVIESSLQLVWTTVLICLEVIPLPWKDMTHIPDILGNTFPLPVSCLSLLFSVLCIVSQLTFYWRNFGLRRKRTGQKSCGDTAEGNVSGSCLVYPLVATHLVFRVGVLALVSIFANIYSVSLLGINLISYSLIRLTRTCQEQDSVLGEAVASLANSLLLIPTSTDQRSHNLYVIHDAVTNVFMFGFLISIQIINFDYNKPLFIRPNTLVISHSVFIIIILSLVVAFCLNYLCRIMFFFANQRCEKKAFWKIKIKFTKMNILKALLVLVNFSLLVTAFVLATVSYLLNTNKNLPAVPAVSAGEECGVWLQSATNKTKIAPVSCEESTRLQYYMKYSSLATLLNETDCLANTLSPQSRTLYDELDLSHTDDKAEEEWTGSDEIKFPTSIIFLCFMLSLSMSWFIILMRSYIRKLLRKIF